MQEHLSRTKFPLVNKSTLFPGENQEFYGKLAPRPLIKEQRCQNTANVEPAGQNFKQRLRSDSSCLLTSNLFLPFPRKSHRTVQLFSTFSSFLINESPVQVMPLRLHFSTFLQDRRTKEEIAKKS